MKKICGRPRKAPQSRHAAVTIFEWNIMSISFVARFVGLALMLAPLAEAQISPLVKWDNSSCLPTILGASVQSVAEQMVAIANANALSCNEPVQCTNKMSLGSVASTSFEVISQCTGTHYQQPVGSTCPDGFEIVVGGTQCTRAHSTFDKDKQLHQPCSVGNPIDMLSGNKFASEVDYRSSVEFPLEVIRYYNSTPNLKAIATSTSFGGYWRFSYDRSLDIGSGVIIAVRPNGAVFYYGLSNGIWSSDPDVNASLKQTAAGTWERTDENRFVETYSSSGKLISIADPVGRTQNLTYTNGVLVSITDSAGNALIIGRDTNGRVASIQLPTNEYINYGYDLIGNLKTVSFPPSAPLTYLYEDSNGPRRLTGITDEAGIRFATYQYDSVGRAIKSEHAGAAGKVSIDYTMLENPGAPASTVTNSLGKTTTYHYSTIQGVRKITHVEGHASTNCAAANRLITYDSNGFVESSTDWKGIVTTYVHDARGLETSRTEAVGTSAARTITTEWHPTWRLPTKITEPGRVTEFSYYTNGQLKDRTERAVP